MKNSLTMFYKSDDVEQNMSKNKTENFLKLKHRKYPTMKRTICKKWTEKEMCYNKGGGGNV